MAAAKPTRKIIKNRARPSGQLLLVEDEIEAVEQLTFRFKREGYSVAIAENALQARSMGTNPLYDVIIMDYGLPDGDGDQVCRGLRKRGVDTPVLMLTGRDRLDEKVSALDMGADDYLTKPFEFDELFARIRALTRRGPTKISATDISGGLAIDANSRTVNFEGRLIELSPLEFELLMFFIAHANHVVSRRQILDAVWTRDNRAPEDSTNAVDVYIRYLRKKIWGSRDASPIRTIRGAGYIFRD